MKQKKNFYALIICCSVATSAFSQPASELSNQLSESSSPVILKHCGIMVEANYIFYKSSQVQSNQNIGMNARIGILDLFELNADYEVNIMKYNFSNEQIHGYYSGGKLNNIGFKFLAYTSNNKNFMVAVAGNYFFKKPAMLSCGRSFGKPGDYGYMKINKTAEVTFRNIVCKKFIINYSASYNYRDGLPLEASVGGGYKICKKLYAGLDAITTFNFDNYYEGYYFIRTNISYSVLPSLMIQLSTSGNPDKYNKYSKQGMLGISWKIK
jgi:hypothetical protein